MVDDLERLRLERERKIKEAPGVDIDRINWKRGAVTDRMKLEGRAAYERRERSKLTRSDERD